MRTASTAYVSAEDVLEELQKLNQKIDSIVLSRNESGGGGGEVVWASQATLSKRYDMSKSNMCRLLMVGTSNGEIRMCQPNGGVRKYNVEDVDAYMIAISRVVEPRLKPSQREAGE